jgi:hypothetical protein
MGLQRPCLSNEKLQSLLVAPVIIHLLASETNDHDKDRCGSESMIREGYHVVFILLDQRP